MIESKSTSLSSVQIESTALIFGDIQTDSGLGVFAVDSVDPVIPLFIAELNGIIVVDSAVSVVGLDTVDPLVIRDTFEWDTTSNRWDTDALRRIDLISFIMISDPYNL